MNSRLIGRWGEQAAAAFLKKQKYLLIGLNYSSRFGEIDLIVENKDYIVFVEVKLRKNSSFAEAKEFVDRRKQEKIVKCAQMWLAANNSEKQTRFDVIEIYAPDGINTKKPIINHIENAFTI